LVIAFAEVCLVVCAWSSLNVTYEGAFLWQSICIYLYFLVQPLVALLSVIYRSAKLAVLSICIHSISALVAVAAYLCLALFDIFSYYFRPWNLLRCTVLAFPVAFFLGIILWILIEFARILRQGGTGYEAITIGHQEVIVEAPIAPDEISGLFYQSTP